MLAISGAAREPREMSVEARSPRTQAERRETTRNKLLDAAVECLLETGYSNTSVVQIQQRSGVSRGALQHYWPSKPALVVAAVDRLIDEASEALVSRVDQRLGPAERIGVGVDELWVVLQSPLSLISLELAGISHTDPELRAVLLPREDRLRDGIRLLCQRVFGDDLATHPRFATLCEVLIHSMQGAALTADLDPRGKGGSPLVEEWKAILRDGLEVGTRRR